MSKDELINELLEGINNINLDRPMATLTYRDYLKDTVKCLERLL